MKKVFVPEVWTFKHDRDDQQLKLRVKRGDFLHLLLSFKKGVQ